MEITVEGFLLQDSPNNVYVASIQGRWLLEHTTPSWRAADPKLGFQRIVSTKRATDIARTVLDQGRTFPNAIILATDVKELKYENNQIKLPQKIKFLVVDGQHRLWAQNFSAIEAKYACFIHLGLNEQQMASLFLEINANQKRVPASLRWDLVRLIRSEEDPNMTRAVDLVYHLAIEENKSPLFQRIDLTGEVPTIKIKQASLAPEIKAILNKPQLKEFGFDIQANLLTNFFAAVQNRDPGGWKEETSVLYTNRIFRVLIRLIPEILAKSETTAEAATPATFYKYLKEIDLNALDPKEIRGQQGLAGMSEILTTIKNQIKV